MRKSLILTTVLLSLALASHALAAHPFWGTTRRAVSTTPILRGSTRTLQHPVWGSAAQQTGQVGQRVPNAIGHPYYDQQSVTEYANREKARKDRVCERVKKRFGADRSMFERVNKRLEERFGYKCAPSVITEEIEEAELRIALSPFHPVGDTIVKGSSRIPVLSTVFSASCTQDVIVDDVHITNFGPGLVSDIPYLWMSINGARVSRFRELGRNKDVQLRFKRPLVVPKCESVTVDFFATTSTTSLSSAKHTFSIDSSDHVFSNAPVTGEFPIIGKRFTISSAKTGKLSVSYLDIDEDPKLMGMDDEVIGRFRVELDNLEDQTLHAVTLEQQGSAYDGDFIGIYLRSTQGHARLTEHVEYASNDLMTLFFDPPQPIEKGGSIEIDVVANIVANTGSTIQLGLSGGPDIYAVGQRFGYGKNGQLYGSHVEIEGEPRKLRIR